MAPSQALKYAAEIAAVLRAIHGQGRSHGAIHPAAILLTGSGLTFDPPGEPSQQPPTADIVALGGVLYEMLTGQKAGAKERPELPSGLPRRALQLAERCLAATREAGPDIHKVTTEIRLLLILARQQSERGPEPEPVMTAQPIQPAVSVPLAQSGPPVGSRCPKCRGFHVHKSQPQTAFDSFMAALGFSPRRCHRCFYRFLLIFGVKVPLSR